MSENGSHQDSTSLKISPKQHNAHEDFELRGKAKERAQLRMKVFNLVQKDAK